LVQIIGRYLERTAIQAAKMGQIQMGLTFRKNLQYSQDNAEDRGSVSPL
jgi:hypothetical protein